MKHAWWRLAYGYGVAITAAVLATPGEQHWWGAVGGAVLAIGAIFGWEDSHDAAS